jgi:hypothetical protein
MEYVKLFRQSSDENEEDYESKDEGEESIKNFKVILDRV